MKKISIYIYLIIVSIAVNIGVVNAQGVYRVLPRPDVYYKYYGVNGNKLNIKNKYIIESFNKDTRKYKEDLDEVNNVEKILVIPFEFEDVKFKNENVKEIYSDLMEKVKEYYELNSNYINNKRGMTIDYEVVDKITSEHKMEFYAKSNYSVLDVEGSINISEIAKEAVSILQEKNIPLKEFDKNNDGVIDHVLIIHAGKGQEETLDDSFIWSHRFEIQNNGEDFGGVRALNYTTVPENTKVGTIVHELGHDFGLPDLYDVYNVNQGVGIWDVMGAGSWNYLDGQAPGECPSNLSAWSRELLGWVKAEEVDESKTLIFKNSNGISNVYKIYLRDKYGNKNKNEYYLLEYRRRINFDEALPQEGILIWHIDEKIIEKTFFTNEVNTDGEKMGVELVQADGAFHLNSSFATNRGDAGDPFPGATQNNKFGAVLYGLNLSNGGQYSFIEGENFNILGEIAMVDIKINTEAPKGKVETYAPLNESIVGDKIVFSFDLIPNCNEYKLQISEDADFEDPVQITVNKDDLTEYIDNKIIFNSDIGYLLKNYTKYYWRISATNPATKLNNVVWSNVNTMYYTEDEDLEAPGNFTWDITDEKITLNWVNEKDATGYVILCNGVEIYLDTNKYVIENDNKEYKIRVRSVNDTVSSNYDEEIIIDTTFVPTINAELKAENEELPRKIILTIEGDLFRKDRDYNRSTVKLDKKTIPEDITIENVSWINEKKIEIDLKRNDTLVLDDERELGIILSKYLFKRAYDKEIKKIVVLEPNNKNHDTKVKFSFSGENKNRLMHIKKGMKYSINGGFTYEICEDNDILLDVEQMKKICNANEIIIQNKDSYQVIELLNNDNIPNVIANGNNGIDGLTNDMEYSFDEVNWSDEILKVYDIEENIFVRYKGNGRVKPSKSVKLIFE